jgi:hypothetical protein
VSSEQKALEARLSVEAGADEVERVIHIGAALANDWEAVEADVRAVRRAIPDTVLKVTTLTCFLTDEQKREATAAVVRAGAEFVKTSTGFGTGGATLDDVRRLRDTEVCFMNDLLGAGLLLGVSGSGECCLLSSGMVPCPTAVALASALAWGGERDQNRSLAHCGPLGCPDRLQRLFRAGRSGGRHGVPAGAWGAAPPA